MTDRFQNALHRIIKIHTFLHVLDTAEQKMTFRRMAFQRIDNAFIIGNIYSDCQQHYLLLPQYQLIFNKKFLFQCRIHILP